MDKVNLIHMKISLKNQRTMVSADFDIAEHNIQFPFVSANRACVPL